MKHPILLEQLNACPARDSLSAAAEAEFPQPIIVAVGRDRRWCPGRGELAYILEASLEIRSRLLPDRAESEELFRLVGKARGEWLRQSAVSPTARLIKSCVYGR
jgi:hypothetical protein